jgi:hypothetical protein
MLCTFHAIWKHFKEHIRPTLPKKGMLLTEKGREYGKLSLAKLGIRIEYVPTFIAFYLKYTQVH